MPQIAQQDYLRFTNPKGLDLASNYSIIGALLGAVEKDTLFDIIIDDKELNTITRVLSVYDKKTFFVAADDGTPYAIEASDYTRQQYEGLGFIQKEVFELDDVWDVPRIGVRDTSILEEVVSGNALVNEDGYAWKGVEADGRLESFELSEMKLESGFIVVPFDIVQKLIEIALQ